MPKFTKNEQAVYNLIANISYSGSVAIMEDLENHTDLGAKQARGVISSLVKKNLISVDEFQNGFEPVENQYWPTSRKHDERGEDQLWGQFWSDELSEAGYDAELIKDDEVKA